MGRVSKKIYWAGAGAVFLLVLFLALAFIVPRVVDSAWLQKSIKKEAAKHCNGRLDFYRAEISILPSPSVILRQVNLSIPESADLTFDNIRIQAKLLPLISGNIQFDQVVLDKPDFSLQLPEMSRQKTDRKPAPNLSEILEIASVKLSPLVAAIPDLSLGIQQGTLSLFADDKQVLLIENIAGTSHFNNKSLSAAISCRSNIWESMELQAEFTPGAKEGKGRVALKQLNSKTLADYFLPGEKGLAEGSVASLQVNSSISPESGLSADIKGAELSFAVLHEDKKIPARVENLQGSIQHTDEFSSITVADITFSYPRVHLSGSFKFDPTVPHAGLAIKSQNSDLKSVAQVLPVFLNAVFGEMEVVEEIFNITRGGMVSEASLHIDGKSPADLAVFESMRIRGNIQNADITLADLGLDLHGVTGEVAISNGVMAGKNLQAKLGDTHGSNGTLVLGLIKKKTTPFQLDLELNADLTDVFSTMKQLLPDKNLQHYLTLFESTEGTSQGRLTLGKSLESLTARVEVDKVQALVNFKPIPYPIRIDGGRIIYDGKRLESYNMQGKIGNSS
ncbi:MAG: AsmA family protein, partial [Desulfobulbales bacterium]|nr:AsmA family protein [Desulfobulbales bacterium]